MNVIKTNEGVNRLTVLTRANSRLFTFLQLKFENVGMFEHLPDFLDEVNLSHQKSYNY